MFGQFEEVVKKSDEVEEQIQQAVINGMNSKGEDQNYWRNVEARLRTKEK